MVVKRLARSDEVYAAEYEEESEGHWERDQKEDCKAAGVGHDAIALV